MPVAADRSKEQHPVLPIPSLMDFHEEGITEREWYRRWSEACSKRTELMNKEETDPLRYGYEPGVWKISDALLGQPCRDLSFIDKLKKRFNMSWDDWCQDVRELLGMLQVIKIQLIAGTNRSGKTEYAGKRVNQNMTEVDDFQVWCYAETNDNSIRIQQPALYKYLDPNFRAEKIKTDTAYVNYSKQRGFVDGHYILPETLSENDLRNYSQDVKTAEGGDLDMCWADELIPPSYMNTLPARIASRGGFMIVTFTPVEGYTPVVAEFQNSAEIALAVPGYLLPIDGGEPDVPRAMGFESQEEMDAARKEGIMCRPWDVLDWYEWACLGRQQQLDGKRPKLELRQAEDGRMVGPGFPLPPAGRHFKMMPRVKRCFDPERAIVYYHPMDNPYANPLELWNRYRKKARKEIQIRMYGEAERMQANQCPKFSRSVHEIPDEKIPQDGTVYQIMDPTPGGRPYVFGYFRVTRHGAYLFSEFPRVDLRPEEVDLDDFPSGEWAVVSERKGGVNDGDPGPACQPIGWGYSRYKQQFAVEEGWEDAESGKPVSEWTEEAGAKIKVMARYMDPAAAEMPRQNEEETLTLIEEFENIDVFFEHAMRGKNTADRIRAINDALDYDVNEDGEITRYPWLRIAESCKNSIYCLENYLGVDGSKGVMKDFIDILGYFCKLELDYLEDEAAWENSGGGHM